MNNDLQKVKDWLINIGIPVKDLEDLPCDDVFSFIDNIKIYQGELYINDKTHPGDLLHEAGHIATTPSILRVYLKGNLNIHVDIMNTHFNEVINAYGINSDKFLALINSGETAAIAWSYAAAIAAKVDSFLPFENGFDESGEYGESGESLHSSLEMSQNGKSFYMGINSLFHGKMLEKYEVFPELKRWLQI